MTRALYYENGTQLTFDAVVQEVNGSEVALDATAFYPEGGGQNGDAGRLTWATASAAVLDTRKDKATGLIWHKLAGALPPAGTPVVGQVDAARRWRQMQRHSGEHLLAQAFRRVNPAFSVAAVGMRNPECTLDLEGDPAEIHVQAAETLLRETLGRTDLVLDTPTVPEDDLHLYAPRRETKVSGQVRLVIFRDSAEEAFDVSACGGLHVPRASLAGPVVILRTERIRAGLTRVVFMAGEEAGEYLARVYGEARARAQGFSVPVDRLPERVVATLAERDALKAEAAALRDALAATVVRTAPIETVNGLPVRCVVLDDIAMLLPTLNAVSEGGVVLALAPGGRCGIACKHLDRHFNVVDHLKVDVGAILSRVLKAAGGKGGGKSEIAQGVTPQPDGFFAAIKEALAAFIFVPIPERQPVSQPEYGQPFNKLSAPALGVDKTEIVGMLKPKPSNEA
ncbi:alanyl-tRNA editing protein [Deinococcus sp. Arct2-2]|uniref:alanine--tRNA ligase-related protein n=1 Tax=Deinococcus sp. Arct2-2 TaxID=2568653 RepID=UPI0010A3B5AC|nr:alanyl-tRNA editing protein [Deinococcus sp. Arct2-2]THF69426.1 alanyl-tRNA editing protein [Deinococcus sp. Arct2-2]